MSGVIAAKKFHESAILDQRIGKLKMGKTNPTSEDLKNYMELLQWANHNSDNRIIKLLKSHEEYMKSHAAASKIKALFKSYKSNLGLAGDERAREKLFGVKRAAAYRTVMAAKRMQRSLLLLNKWIGDRIVELAIAYPDKVSNHKLLFRFCDINDPNTMRGKQHQLDANAIKQAFNAAREKERQLQKEYIIDKKNDNKRIAFLSAEKERQKAQSQLSMLNKYRGLEREEKSRIEIAIAHIGGRLGTVSPFVSLAENPSGFVETDNKVAQSIVRSPHNYVPAKEFKEFPTPAGKYAQARYFAIFLIPKNKLLSPERLKTHFMEDGSCSEQEAEDRLEAVISAGEHLFWAKEGIKRYMVASTLNPF